MADTPKAQARTYPVDAGAPMMASAAREERLNREVVDELIRARKLITAFETFVAITKEYPLSGKQNQALRLIESARHA